MIGYLTPNYPLVAAFRTLPKTRTRPADRITRQIFKMAPKLSDYFRDDEIRANKGDLDRPISGLAMDSRRVLPGNLFFALPGRRADGNSFIDEAIQRGAVGIVAEKIPAATAARVTYIQVNDARRALAQVSQRYFGFPDKSLELVGVTGTNGKTTVTNLIKHLLSTSTQRVGLVGTVNYDLGARVVPSYRTTPESLELFGMLAQMRDAGCRQAAMEVSSHGIDQHRVLGMQFAVSVFTNLTRDHLDYHKTLDAYYEVKTRLFNGGIGSSPRAAVVNLDDAYGRRLAAEVPKHVRVVTFGEAPDATVRAENVKLNFKGTSLTLVWPEGRAEIESPFIGRYNVSNLLAAFAACYALGRDPSVIALRLKSFPGVSGRMERIEEGQPYNVLVDYAHTDDALRNALGMLRAITPGRLFVVFGCGGNRDRTKRPLMTGAVQEFADFAWATADNPRGEQLGQIFSDMKTGVKAPDKITFVEDRRHAISLALDAAQPGDCLLIAGKGHETYQEFADTIVPFDDRQVVRELIGIKSIKPV
ncbi:UDP-N-acetylmuramoyl-L-alanyl-D-glutamate--2,6-diaminopimelate ligase [Oleiharenicola lentus]|uniref:UDP-N-acetylmuramoyl-L-alanyl-D-glutamate--2,6-diaminopimelate ligase n=1 Tax=Oleiharenicola lentus TaxID=2508720 RepID=A0A4Q1CCG9_9BACT|nr:UDP-N-acetylmuramoyl-L-alanyl-D-glutamate--2,6-diaminopimelate ligase [Oleiharenicola lentus]RXK56837.1 UDP-N-acetylmuramoyl-L-alanyl-D-glutamate--2,6-diaminopimelate ligase [Oleiharenicola lentus]